MPPDKFPVPRILPDALDEALESFVEDRVGPLPVPTILSPPPNPKEQMDRLANICHGELQNRSLLGGPLENRTLFELRVISTEDGQAFFLSLLDQRKRELKNDNNMIVPWLLGVTEEFDPYRPPTFATGDLASICLPRPESKSQKPLANYLEDMGTHVKMDPSNLREEPVPSPVADKPKIVVMESKGTSKDTELIPLSAPGPQPEPVIEPAPPPQRRLSVMRGFDKLREAKQRKDNLEAQVVLAAQKAASAIAAEVGFEIAFPTFKDKFGKGYIITKQGDLWCLATTNGDSKHLHPKWNYQESRQFGIHVKDGLIDSIAGVLHSQLDEEEKALGSFALPDTDIPTNTVGLDVNDEQLLSVLAHSSDDIPVLRSKDYQCIDCGTLYGLEITKNNIPPNECPTCKHKGSVISVASLPQGKPVVGRQSLIKTG